MSFYSSIKQSSQALEAAKRLQDEYQRNQAELDRLKGKVDRLTLLCQAMWHILRQMGDVPEEDLAVKFRELEEMHGEKALPGNCVACSRPIHMKRKMCIFCGAKQPETSIFDVL